MDKTFLRWLKNTHPEIIKEYQDMLKGAIKELKSLSTRSLRKSQRKDKNNNQPSRYLSG